MQAIRIGDLLKSKGLLNDKQLELALIEQKITGDMLGNILVGLGFISSIELGQLLAAQTGMEFLDLNDYIISEDALKLVPKTVAERNQFLPLYFEDERMSIGITNPGNIAAIDAVMGITRKQPRVYIVDTGSFRDGMERAYFFLENPVKEHIDRIIAEIKSSEVLPSTAVSSLTELLILYGIRNKATDIHINPTANLIQIFYRIDGVLQHGHSLPKLAHSGIVSRIKILSQLDIAEQRLPQDGSFRFTILNRDYYIRVSSVPTIYGEAVVLRLLAGSGTLLSLESLGFDHDGVKRIRNLFKRSYGIVLLTGPTGCGKTTTLYSALRELNRLERSIITVEDPVEYKLSLIRQTQVNEKAGYDFGIAGRNFMRQDPDVMLLGEIRDEETAKLAIRSAITGHLVISTLHTIDAVTAIPRLLDMNVDRFLLSSALLAVVAQRLARKICLFCKEVYTPESQESFLYKEHGFSIDKAFRGTGCKKCNYTGYLGRTVVGEVMIANEEIKEMVYSGASIASLKKVAIKNGMIPLLEDAMKKAAEGITTSEEALRVAG